MVRTKADRVPGRAVGGKAPAKSVKTTPVKKVTGTSKGKNYSGGNPYHPRETPEWQKPITCFMNKNSSADCIAGPSSSQEIGDHNENNNTGDEAD